MTADPVRPRIDQWRSAAGIYWGLGDGSESGPFTGRVEVTDRTDSVELAYEAWSAEQGLQHRERAVLAPTAAGLQMVTVISEVPGHLVFVHDGQRFELSTPGPYAMVVDLTVADRRLTWTWLWAPSGQTPVVQSKLNADRID